MSFFDTAAAALPTSDRDLRKEVLARFQSAGWPGPALESWHYSDWSGLAERQFHSAANKPAPIFGFDRVQPLAFAQQELDPFQAPSAFALDTLNRAFAEQGVDKTIDGHAHTPFLITQHVSGRNTMRHLRHRLGLGAGAKATIVLWDAPGTGETETLLTSVLHLTLAAGSHLTLIRVQDADPEATRALHLSASVQADATLQLIQLDLGGKRVRQELEVTLAAPNARFEQAGLVAIGGKSRVDHRSHIWHAAPHCKSSTSARLIAAGSSRAILNAKVQVQPGAAKTDSETRIASLLLSDKAEIDAKPELEIYADDVQCAHGATFGQLDEDAAFYLRSRGLSTTEAQALLTQAFAQSALDRIPLPGLREWAEQRVRILMAQQTP